MADPSGTKGFSIERIGLPLKVSCLFVYCVVCAAIVAAGILFGTVRHQFCTGWSATDAGTRRDLALLLCSS